MKSVINLQGYPVGLEDPVSFDDPVWTILHIALYLDVHPDSVLSVVNSYGFPTPLVNQRRNRRWLAADVKRFFEKRSQGELSNRQIAGTKNNTYQEPNREIV
jgi:hypothetical protein